MQLVKGLGISTGREMGVVHKLDDTSYELTNVTVAGSECENEIKRIENAFEEAEEQLKDILEQPSCSKETNDILAAHIAIVNDNALQSRVRVLIIDDLMCAEDALYTAIEDFAKIMEGIEDEYMKERATDIRDVGKRILRALRGIPAEEDLDHEIIIVAQDLTPSTLSSLDRKYIKAIVSGTGGKTCHVAIMANCMGIPAVAGLGNEISQINEGDTLIVNGKNGYVYIDPDDATKAKHIEAKKKDDAEKERQKKFINKKAVTKDGRREVEVCANIAFVNECGAAKETGAEGIGLYRTEFLYMDSPSWPDEETQFESYRQVAEAMAPSPVIIRTMDIGGDKALPYMNIPEEDNPFLGHRAIRISLSEPEMFKTQLRALLRASHFGKIRIMFPMVSCVKEIREAKEYLEICKAELKTRDIPFDDNIETGIMVEIPAAAIMADKLAPEIDFFSIGTNDLIQYTMAADRMNQKVAHLYDCFQPAVLRLIKMTIDAAHRHGKFTGMCGEMAGNADATALLVGMGLDEFSMSAGSILRFKSNIAKITYSEAKELAEKCLNSESCEEINALIKGGSPDGKNENE